MRIEDDIKLDFKDVLIRPKRSTLKSRKDVDLYRVYTFKHTNDRWKGVPIMASNMDTIGTFPMARALQKYDITTCIHKHYDVDEWKKEANELVFKYFAVSIGTTEDDWDKLLKVYAFYPDIRFICIDVANGYGEYFPDFIKMVRDRFKSVNIIAGNVVTAEMTEQLILSGADIVKVGIGSGSVCTTRLQTGVGYPQLSAVIECADAAHGLGGHIISDGGCRTAGDVAKAFGAGADFVMLGGMLAGHLEAGGLTKVNGKQVKRFYGMSSKAANDMYSNGLREYRATEGKEVYIECRGPVKETVQEVLGGLRSTCTYVGAPTLKQLSKCTTFIRVTQQHAVFA
jgi:GMP reductase